MKKGGSMKPSTYLKIFIPCLVGGQVMAFGLKHTISNLEKNNEKSLTEQTTQVECNGRLDDIIGINRKPYSISETDNGYAFVPHYCNELAEHLEIEECNGDYYIVLPIAGKNYTVEKAGDTHLITPYVCESANNQ